jgi:hypothetical protein
MDDLSLTQWTAVSTSDVLVLLGEGQTLPWVDGVRYLGRDPLAPHLLLPTNRTPGVPVDLFESALIQRSPVLSPFAVIPELGNLPMVRLSVEIEGPANASVRLDSFTLAVADDFGRLQVFELTYGERIRDIRL